MTRHPGTTIAKFAAATAPLIVFALIQVALTGEAAHNGIDAQDPMQKFATSSASPQDAAAPLPQQVRARLRAPFKSASSI